MQRLLILLGLAVVLLGAPVATGACSGEPEEPATTVETPDAVPEEGAGAPSGVERLAPLPTGQEKVFAFEPVPPGGPTTLVVGQGQEPDSLYIYGGSMLAGSHITNSIYDGPIEGLDYDFQAVILEGLPKLEEPGSGATLEMVTVETGARYVDAETQAVITATEPVEDLPQLTVQFTIREGVTWQDGTSVTAEDSVWSARLACDPDTGTSKVLCDRTARYASVNERTVEWQGLPGYTDQTYYTNFYTPLARHQLGMAGTPMADMTALEIARDEEFARRPFGYGPFAISEWLAGDRIVLRRNEHYWRADEGLPVFDEVVHRFFDDADTLLSALEAGQIDVATQDGLDITQYEAIEAAAAAGALTPYYVSGTVWEHIDFNLDPTDLRAPLGACKEIRHAIALGTDRQAMVDEIQAGRAAVQHTFLPEDHWAYPSDGLVTYDYDPDRAEQTLQDFGFRDTDGDGVREAERDIVCPITLPDGSTKDQLIPAGTELDFTLFTTQGSQMRQETTLLFQQNMREIGVGLELDFKETEPMFDQSEDGPLTGRRYDLAEFAWLTGVQPPVGLYYCENIPGEANGWTGQNSTGWCDPEYDRLAKQADTTLERAAAIPIYADAQAVFTEALPVLPLFARVKVMATRPDLVNFRPNATVNSETWNIETWGIAPAR